MKFHEIAGLPGDGIGPECREATGVVMDRLCERTSGLNLNLTLHRAGAELYRETGETIPHSVMSACLDADAVLLSAIGLPNLRYPDKAHVFRSMAFFREVFMDVAASHPEIHHDAVYVDAMSLYMIQNPWDFDVSVMENQFGDILSDLGD